MLQRKASCQFLVVSCQKERMAKAFRDLIVWQRAIELTLAIYTLTEDLPRAEVYGLQSQMRRAAVSIASNIAEGSARGTRKDFKQFVCIARGSSYELQTQLVIVSALEFGKPGKIAKAEALSQEVGKMLSKLEEFLATRTS